MRVGFLYNHDQIHQVAHSLPVALALADMGGVDVVVAATSRAIIAEIQHIAGSRRLPGLTLVQLDLARASSKIACGMVNSLVPARKLLMLRDNLDFFRSLDALVVTERTSLLLKDWFGLSALRLILIDHGAGDRAIGFGPALARYDHVLAAGPKIRDRMIADAGVSPDKIDIVGYPKFDMPMAEPVKLPMLDNGRRTILYNPHPSPHLSSWYGVGQRVLDYFYRSKRYNLIFAPHVMLFHRQIVVSIDRLRIARVGTVPLRYFSVPHMHIDLGSRLCTDMSYTRLADLYLGDASSQLYEFLHERRPCIFLNPRQLAHEGDVNFAHWRCGQVIAGDEGLDDALDAALDSAWDLHQQHYRAIQDDLFAYTFDQSTETSAHRAACAIRNILTP